MWGRAFFLVRSLLGLVPCVYRSRFKRGRAPEANLVRVFARARMLHRPGEEPENGLASGVRASLKNPPERVSQRILC